MSMPRIIQDTTARLGAMAMTALQKYGSDATKLILIWQNREGRKQWKREKKKRNNKDEERRRERGREYRENVPFF